ncbi:unnamed protein product, partial [Cercopithifilaria johnstoni]
MAVKSTMIQFTPSAPVIENHDDLPSSIRMIHDPPPYSPSQPSHSRYERSQNRSECSEPFLTRISRKSQRLRQCNINIMLKIALFQGLIA